MCESDVRLATRRSALLFAYMRCRMWPGCTRSNGAVAHDHRLCARTGSMCRAKLLACLDLAAEIAVRSPQRSCGFPSRNANQFFVASAIDSGSHTGAPAASSVDVLQHLRHASLEVRSRCFQPKFALDFEMSAHVQSVRRPLRQMNRPGRRAVRQRWFTGCGLSRAEVEDFIHAIRSWPRGKTPAPRR